MSIRTFDPISGDRNYDNRWKWFLNSPTAKSIYLLQ